MLSLLDTDDSLRLRLRLLGDGILDFRFSDNVVMLDVQLVTEQTGTTNPGTFL